MDHPNHSAGGRIRFLNDDPAHPFSGFSFRLWGGFRRSGGEDCHCGAMFSARAGINFLSGGDALWIRSQRSNTCTGAGSGALVNNREKRSGIVLKSKKSINTVSDL
jgi:hypothetical protein